MKCPKSRIVILSEAKDLLSLAPPELCPGLGEGLISQRRLTKNEQNACDAGYSNRAPNQ
jgi:hypothetical protein